MLDPRPRTGGYFVVNGLVQTDAPAPLEPRWTPHHRSPEQPIVLPHHNVWRHESQVMLHRHYWSQRSLCPETAARRDRLRASPCSNAGARTGMAWHETGTLRRPDKFSWHWSAASLGGFATESPLPHPRFESQGAGRHAAGCLRAWSACLARPALAAGLARILPQAVQAPLGRGDF
jgi:hypothetical protein